MEDMEEDVNCPVCICRLVYCGVGIVKSAWMILHSS